jgi:hypothetical protein
VPEDKIRKVGHHLGILEQSGGIVVRKLGGTKAVNGELAAARGLMADGAADRGIGPGARYSAWGVKR